MVEDAVVSESDWKCVIVVATNDERRVILRRDMAPEEIGVYKAHPDTYFGVVRRVPRAISEPYEIFRWLVGVHRGSSKDELLKLCRGCADFAELAQLEQEELLLELCERWTASAVARGSKGAADAGLPGGRVAVTQVQHEVESGGFDELNA